MSWWMGSGKWGFWWGEGVHLGYTNPRATFYHERMSCMRILLLFDKTSIEVIAERTVMEGRSMEAMTCCDDIALGME